MCAKYRQQENSVPTLELMRRRDAGIKPYPQRTRKRRAWRLLYHPSAAPDKLARVMCRIDD